jgi:exoribonuclease R
MIENLAVRTMQKTNYTTKNIGHYGLGFKDYTHFTSLLDDICYGS